MKKQIEEIKELADNIYIDCPACLLEDEAEMIAEYVIERKGYRKASDVAKDIFAWFDDNAVNLNFFTGNFEINLGMYLELKKKYESEGKR